MPPSDHEQERVERLKRAMYSRDLAGKLKDRPRHELDEDTGSVGEDWTAAPEQKIAGVAVGARVVDVTRSALKWMLMIAIAFFVIAVAFFVYFFTIGGGANPASPSNIDITITGPPAIAGGEVSELQVAIVNRNRLALELADLVVTFPPGTRSPTDFATDYPSARIPLGTIEPGGKRQGTISAVFSGAGATQSDVKVELEYRVGGSNAVFVAERAYTLAFRSSPLVLSIDGNTETVSGQPIQFTVNIASNASVPQKDVVLRVEYPFGFTFSGANPAANNPNTWYLGDFAPGEVKSVQISGTVRGEPGDARVFRLSAGTRKSTQSAGIDTKLVDNSHPMRISQSFLGLSVGINGGGQTSPSNDPFATTLSTQTAAVVGPGETVAVTISYVNNLSNPINDAIIVARLSGVPIDGTQVRTTDGFYRSSDGVVLWDKTTTQGKLGTIPAGGRGTLTFTFKAPEGATVGGNAFVDISVNAAGKRLAENNVPQSLQSAVVKKVQIASGVQLMAYGLYHTNPFPEREGPMPPKAQIETTYALLFSVTNTTSRITNARLTATLPSYVRWLLKHAPLTYNVYVDGKLVRDNQFQSPPPGDPCHGVEDVCWSIGEIPAGTGIGGTDPLQAAILIGFTPSVSQIGQVPVLAQNIVLTGTDSATGKQIFCGNDTDQCSAKDVTTNLSGDAGFNPAHSTVIQ